MDGKINPSVYFAAEEAGQCASILLDKSSSFFNQLRANQYLSKLERMYKYYYGAMNSSIGDAHTVGFTGEQGELAQLPVNHFRNIGEHMHRMITSNRPVMEARAVNTDYKSLAQTYVANGVLDYYMRERHLESCLSKAVEMAIVMGAGYVKMEWNPDAGDVFDRDPDTDEPVFTGEIVFTNLSPLDVVMDGTKESWNNEWLLVRSYVNKHNIIAKYPEFKDRILGLPTKSDSLIYKFGQFSNDKTDDIPVYEFFHKKTSAMPEGRYMVFLDPEVVLIDADMPYREIPVYRIVPSEILGTPYGYSPLFDIYPIQENLNALYSTIATNQNAFGVQNIFVPTGANINFASLEGGLNIIEADAKPEPINLTETPAELFKFLEMLVHDAETISGINSVARGNPEASLKSGSALALVQSMALQFISGLQNSYVKLVEECGTGVINLLKDFAMTPRVVAIAGKNNRTEIKEFTSEDISAINRVIVDVGNPLSRTIAGRVQMAEQMMQMNVIKNPQQYFQVMNTGRLDMMFDGEMNELLNIKKENEEMMSGNNVMALALDDHRTHIMEHKAIISDPELRKNAQIVQLVTQHILEHINLLRTTDPDLLQLLGQQPLQPPPQMGGMPEMGLPPGPPQQQQARGPKGSSAPSNVMQQDQTPQINTPNGSEMLPSPATPPAPFQNNPTDPSQMIPG